MVAGFDGCPFPSMLVPMTIISIHDWSDLILILVYENCLIAQQLLKLMRVIESYMVTTYNQLSLLIMPN
jgi:hypothetical protein